MDRQSRRSRSRALLGSATLLLVVLAIIRALDPLPQGLHATYFADANWSSSPVRSGIEAHPYTDGLVDAWIGNPPEVFSTVWKGSFIAVHEDTYTFGTVSDDGAWVYIDGKLIVDDGGQHSPLLATGRTHLDRGVHAIFIKYFQSGGSIHFDLLWAREGAPLDRMPAWALSTRRVTFSRFLTSVILRRAWFSAVVLWLAVLAVVGVRRLGRPLRRWMAVVKADPVYRVLAGLEQISESPCTE